MDGGLDKQKLFQDFIKLLEAMEQVAQGAISAEGAFPLGAIASVEERIARSTIDTFASYEEVSLPDGRLVRRYDNGAVRLENPKSGVIHEERADGSLVVSLPNGRIIFQQFRGEPLLFVDTDRKETSGLARVVKATLPGESVSKFVFHFEDYEGSHLVELETLRYYRLAT